MARTKVTVRRMSDKVQKLPAWMINKEYGGRKRTVYPFKIKQTLPVQKRVNITKNGQVVKTINVKRKSKYFSGKNRLAFYRRAFTLSQKRQWTK